MIEEQEQRASQNLSPPKQSVGFFKQHGLILFYASTCPHCREFAPVFNAWAQINSASILALSFDNQPLPEFPKFLPATTEWVNAAFGGKPIHYPAVFIMSPITKSLYPVVFGSISNAELDLRMKTLIPKIEAFERKGTTL